MLQQESVREQSVSCHSERAGKCAEEEQGRCLRALQQDDKGNPVVFQSRTSRLKDATRVDLLKSIPSRSKVPLRGFKIVQVVLWRELM